MSRSLISSTVDLCALASRAFSSSALTRLAPGAVQGE